MAAKTAAVAEASATGKVGPTRYPAAEQEGVADVPAGS